MVKLPLLFSTLAAVSLASPLVKRSTDITTVDLSTCSGSPQLYSQGILYGMTGNNTPPQEYLEDIMINYESAGGAQEQAQPTGYSYSTDSYNFLFSTVVEAFKRIQSVNGVFIIKMADLWGADEKTGSDFEWPGDNGNWTKYDAFVQQVISDVKSNGMANAYSTQMEVWNEPDINFGGRDQSQYNEMWQRCTSAIRQAYGPNSDSYLPIIGPSTADNPDGGNDWWNSYLSYIQSNGGQSIQPDVWNWHMENGGSDNDPTPPAQYLPGYLSNYGLTTGLGLQNNEFGTSPQQIPSHGAWFKAKYERLKFHALRGNWASNADLSNLLANLLFQDSDGNYQTTGEYQMYKYYKQMSGSPCTSTTGNYVDSFATGSDGSVTALIGTSTTDSSSVAVTFDSVSTYFGSAGTVSAQLINIPYNNGSAVNGWSNSGDAQTLTVSNDQVTMSFDISSDQGSDAWVVQLSTV